MATKRTIKDFFSKTSDEDSGKNELETVTESCKDDKRRKTESRDIKSAWSVKYEWLKYERKSNLFFCDLCIKAGKHNVFTLGKSALIPKADDFNKHELNKEHKLVVSAKLSVEKGEMAKAQAKANQSVKDAVVATMKNVYFIMLRSVGVGKL